jgi:hypothetical protein
MDKAQIVRYALMQITALVYGILAAGAAVKLNKPMADMGYVMPDGYYHAIFFRDYGIYLFVVVIAWTAMVSYYSSSYASREVDTGTLTISGMVFTLLFTVIGTVIAFSGAMPPHTHFIPLQ